MWANDQLFSFSLSVLFVRRNIEQFPIIFIIPEDKFLARHLNIKRVLIYLNQLPLKYQSFALDCLSRNSGKIQNRREKKWGLTLNKMSKRTEKENQNWMQAYIVSFFASDTVALGNWNKMIQREQSFSLFFM